MSKRIFASLVSLILVFNCVIVLAAPPEKPSGEIPSGMGGTPPDMPSGEMPGGMGGTPLEKPSGDIPGGMGETPPDMPDGSGGAPGGSDSASNISHVGATEISSDITNENQTYSSDKSSQNALLVTGGISTINNPTITKTGDSDGDSSDFYGTNAGVLVKDGTLNIDGGTVTTNGSHANGVFAYSKGIINISKTNIKTSSNNSGGIMVTGGGTLTANDVTIETDGNSSAPIRSDRGGGTLTVNGGEYTSNGVGSPAVYSTANIIVNDAKLISTTSEGVVVEGKNSVELNNTTMEVSNTKLNGNSETYKSIFLYQSMSQDAEIGTSHFTANNSKIINDNGDMFFITNTSAVIDLENSDFVNNDVDGAFIRIGSAKWGTTGSNGGDVTLNAKNQKIDGAIVVDDISTLDFSLNNSSSFSGTINGDNTAKDVKVSLDDSATLTLMGDSYITSLDNNVSDNSNINLNGHTLYVNGTALTIGENNVSTNNKVVNVESSSQGNMSIKTIVLIITIVAIIVLCAILVYKFVIKKNNK